MARSFAKLMFQGKTKAAFRLVTEQKRGGLLHLDSVIVPGNSDNTPLTVHNALLSKHPDGQPASPSALVFGNTEPPAIHPVLFESIDAAVIKNASLSTSGAADPSDIMVMDGGDSILLFILPRMISAIPSLDLPRDCAQSMSIQMGFLHLLQTT